MSFKVIIHNVDVNDDSVIIASWEVKENDKVSVGDILLTVETSKAIFDITAEKDGYVKNILFEEGDTVPVLSTVCYLAESNKEIIEIKEVEKSENTETDTKILATKKAKELAKELGVELSNISVDGLIKTRDIISYNESINSVENSNYSNEVIKEVETMDKDFLKIICKDPAFLQLSSESKIFLYKKNGAIIGENVRLNAGSLILGKNIKICDDVSIGKDTIIEGKDISIGKMTSFGSNCNIVSGKINIGEINTIADRVIVDLSGGKTGESELKTGSGCLIAMEAYLNTSRCITLKDNVAISPRAMIYTHSFWQSVLDGYSAAFDSVVINENAWIGSAAQIFPGVRVGKGSIIISNSFVTSSVSDYTMVGGVPAAVIKSDLKKEFTLSKKSDIIKKLISEFISEIKNDQHSIIIKHDNSYEIKFIDSSQKYLLSVLPKSKIEKESGIISVSLLFSEQNLSDVKFNLSDGIISGKQNQLTDELRNFFRRRGLEFSPHFWRYQFKREF